jgi:uncharacterized repeat protein (TIGR03943 family)
VTLSRRTVRLVVLGGWSLCLLALWFAGDIDKYLGPRTAWVIPAGAITLSIATLAYAAMTEGGASARQRVAPTEWLGLVTLGAPILVAFTMHGALLGSLAASNKLSSRGVDLSSLISAQAANNGPTSFLNLSLAEEHPNRAASFGVHPGGLVQLHGFVLGNPARPTGTFQLARIYITCCVADSIALTVHVRPSGPSRPVAKDEWLEVDGVVQGHGHGLTVRAARIIPIPKPGNPYLSFAT